MDVVEEGEDGAEPSYLWKRRIRRLQAGVYNPWRDEDGKDLNNKNKSFGGEDHGHECTTEEQIWLKS